MNNTRRSIALLLALLGAALLSIPHGVSAEPGRPPAVTPLAGGVRLAWRGAPAALGALDAHASSQPLVTIGGVQLPAPLVALRIAGDAPAAPRIDLLTSVPWRGALPAAERYILQAGGAARPDLAAAPDQSPPASPVVVLREGRMRGAHIAVLALSPVFEQGGATRAVTALEATIPGAAPLAEDAAALLAAEAPFIAGAPPINPAAGVGWKVRVTQAGIQRLPGSTLAAAGVSLGNPALLHLYHDGVEVAIEQRGAGGGLELRFYAPPPGDRWNAADTYWLTVEATPGLRMANRSALPGAAAPYPTAIERGVWRDNRLYISLLPGSDGDHWYAADLKTGPGPPPAALTVPLTPTLPLADGTTVLTVTTSAYTSGQHALSVTLGGIAQLATWSGYGDRAQRFELTAKGASAVVELLPGGADDELELDAVAWERPALLQPGGRGAAFDGVAGTYQYQISGAAADRSLYDVSDPRAPVALAIPDGVNAVFEDGPTAHSYVLTGPGTLLAPSVSRSQPYDFATPAGVLYIAPAAFHAALGPLVARRQAQGSTVRVVDVQAIYDAWSYGQLAPDAIRDFLRYAAATWSRPPTAVTLVGDGTSDPLNYYKYNTTTFIPPYLAMVDPWLGETACDVCYARLDGPNPTLDPLPDLLIGRLPVKSAAELTGLVAKLVSYETSPLDASWRSRNLYIADDADPAGDFAAQSDASVARQPAGVEIQRMYYDPSAPHIGEPWREPDAMRARALTLAALNAGMGLVNYIGHGNMYQWATTDYTKSPPYLLGLYDPDDLTNGARQPILLEMTCWTGAFQTPNNSGTTIDERFVLRPNGGAIAVWGPTGQGVSHGHAELQRGFYNTLWGAPPLRASLGTLTAGGYLELFTRGVCCQDALATFVLLGDPLTPARVLAARRVYLPAARR